MATYSTLNRKLLAVLKVVPLDIGEAEKLTQAGADVNAMANGTSLIAEAEEFRSRPSCNLHDHFHFVVECHLAFLYENRNIRESIT